MAPLLHIVYALNYKYTISIRYNVSIQTFSSVNVGRTISDWILGLLKYMCKCIMCRVPLFFDHHCNITYKDNKNNKIIYKLVAIYNIVFRAEFLPEIRVHLLFIRNIIDVIIHF